MNNRSAIPAKRSVLLAFAAGLSLFAAGCENPSGSSDAKRSFTPAFSSTHDQVLAFLATGQGGPNAKLAYIDRTKAGGELCFIDFSEKTPAPAIHVIAAADKPAVPVISPDGKWIVYASGAGAEAGSPPGTRSSVYLVRMEEGAQPVLIAADSACEPRFVQNNPGKLAVIYTTQAPDLAWEGHGRTMQVDVDVSGAAAVPGVPQALWPSGGFTGGLSWDGRFLCGGGGHVAMIDLKAVGARPDTLSFKGIQSCNASISSSRVRTDAMMYLNTEGSDPAVNGGKGWGEWQTILIGNKSTGLLKAYSHPASFANSAETEPKSFSDAKWHHSEWSNHPYFATATVNVNRFFKSGDTYENTMMQERIYLINLKDSSYLEVLRPAAMKYTGVRNDVSGFYWPWLWVEVPAAFSESADWLTPRP
jgi:hypothetical protein